MNKLIATATLSFLTVSSFAIGSASQVNAVASELRAIEEITTELTFPTDEDISTKLSQTSEETQIAQVGWACETYSDGSWKCCIADVNGNVYCEWGY